MLELGLKTIMKLENEKLDEERNDFNWLESKINKKMDGGTFC